MSQAGLAGASGGGSLLEVIDGDTGSAVPSGGVITISGGSTGIVTSASGSTVDFVLHNILLPTTTSSVGQIQINSVPFINAFDSAGTNTNTYVGYNSGSVFTGTGVNNTGIGLGALNDIGSTASFNTVVGAQSFQNANTSGAMGTTAIGAACLKNYSPGIGDGTDNTGVGHQALNQLNGIGGQNVAIGAFALGNVSTGGNNIALGYQAGNSITSSHNSNISIGNVGAAENNTIRIGTQGTSAGQQNVCFIAGITGATPSSSHTPQVMLCSSQGQIAPISSSTSGFVLTSNGTATPTFQNVSASGSITKVNGDSGSATPSSGTLTITGGTTGLTTSGSSSTLSLTGTLGIANGGTNAGSYTQTNGIVVYDGSSLLNYSGPQIDAGGNFTNTSQPAFMGYNASAVTDVTGNGTVYTVLFDTINFDNSSNFDTSSGTFTASVAGRYFFYATVLLTNVGAAHTAGTIRIQQAGSGSFFFDSDTNPATIRQGTLDTNDCTIAVQGFIHLAASDTMKVTVDVAGSTATVGVFGASGQCYTSFGGWLVC